MMRPETGVQRLSFLCLALLAATVSLAAGAQPVVNESARSLPLVYEADVAIVGGSTGAVSAAVAAAESGARVFLAAPRHYLGEDMCAPFRLWLEPGEAPETPLEKALFREPRVQRGLEFTYEADLPSVNPHLDTAPPTVLTDGRWNTAFTQSVQYNGDVTITADLGETKDLKEVRVMYFQSDRSFEVDTITVSTSDDRTTWSECASLRNPHLGAGNWIEAALSETIPLDARTRHVKLHITKGESAQRVLLGEIQIHLREPEEEVGTGTGDPLAVPPMQIKSVLETALLDAGVEFLYGCYATGVLTDSSGASAGLEIVNRAGRQAVVANVIIDATDRAWFARTAGAEFTSYPSGTQVFRRIVGGGEPRTGADLSHEVIRLARPLGGSVPAAFGNSVPAVNASMALEFPELFEYMIPLPMRDGSYRSFAEAEQMARDLTYRAEGLVRSESIWQVPPDAMRGAVSLSGSWPGANAADLGAFRPAGITRFYVMGGCADISREAASALVRPLESMRVGARIGSAAAKEAAGSVPLSEARLAGKPGDAFAPGDTREPHCGLRPTDTPSRWVQADARSVPVLGDYDVVVAGGGTSGAAAAIGAARSGARTLVVEYQPELGGVGTVGLIGIYCAGYRKGFTAELEAGIAQLGSPSYVDGKMEWWRREIRKAGGEIWFGVLACGAFVDGDLVKGVVVATPEGRGIVLAKTVVDATGNGDVAIAAGAEPMYVGVETVAMQGTGLPKQEIGASYINTDWTYVDENDMVNVRSAFVAAKRANQGAWDLGQLIDTRERRRVLGDYVLSPLDIINQRTFPDTVGISQGGRLDTHGFTIHPYYLINNHLGGIAYTPYRCLLPKGLEGILVVGLAVSAHRDATPSIRMQPCMQNLGYAVGCAAAMAAVQGGRTRSIDIRKLQEHLVSVECLTPDVPAHQDSFPLPEEALRDAICRLIETDYQGLGVIMASWDRALPLVREALVSSPTPEGKLRCAHVLGVMGDAAGFDTLADKVRSCAEFDTGNIDTYFPCLTWLDSHIIALGRTRDPRAVPIILEKLSLLGNGDAAGAFSHYRAVCEALECLGDTAAAEPLAQLLKRCGGDVDVVTIEKAEAGATPDRGGVRNLIIARVLYRCGDWEGLGHEVLSAYTFDVRGVYAQHAKAVLAHKAGDPTQPDGWIGL